MENIAVIFGGRSVEHDISIISALQVMKNLSKKYNLIPVYIRSDGVMVSGDNLQQPRTYLDYAKNVKKEVEVGFACGKKQLYFYLKNYSLFNFNIKKIILQNLSHCSKAKSNHKLFLIFHHLPYLKLNQFFV